MLCVAHYVHTICCATPLKQGIPTERVGIKRDCVLKSPLCDC